MAQRDPAYAPSAGARRLLIESMRDQLPGEAERKVDLFLALLWTHGYKVVPLEQDD